MSIDELIQGAEQLMEFDYDSPKATIWKKHAKDYISLNYGKDYLRMFERIFRVARMSRGRQDANSMFHDKVRNATGLLTELKDIQTKAEPAPARIRDPTGDAIKDEVIQWYYNQQKDEPTRDIGWSKFELIDELSDESYNESDVSFAFNFLEDEGYFKSTTKNKVKYYRLSSKALSKILPASDYSKKPSESTPRILNNGGVIVLGNNFGGIAIEKRQDIINSINEFDIALLEKTDIEKIEKVDLHESSETIKSQLKRQNPDFTIIKSAWKTIETAPSFAEFGASVLKLKAQLEDMGV